MITEDDIEKKLFPKKSIVVERKVITKISGCVVVCRYVVIFLIIENFITFIYKCYIKHSYGVLYEGDPQTGQTVI